MSRTRFRVFISGVSSEFEQARTGVASDLRARGVEVRVQEDFRQEPGRATTLSKLDAYIKNCDSVVAIVGLRSGSSPTTAEAEPYAKLLPADFDKASYTQWEFFLARTYRKRCLLYHGRGYKPDRPASDSDDPDLQARYVRWLFETEGFDRSEFASADQLGRKVLLQDWPNEPPPDESPEPFEIEFGAGSGSNYQVTSSSSEPGQLVNDTCELPVTTLQAVLSESATPMTGAMRFDPGKGDGRLPTEAIAREIGKRLQRSLADARIWQHYASKVENLSDEEPLPLVINAKKAPDVAQLPWEFLFDPERDGFLIFKATRPLVRSLGRKKPRKPLLADERLKLLVAVAEPPDQAPLAVGMELAKLHERLDHNEIVVLDPLMNPSVRALEERVATDDPHIVHFIGHGGVKENGQGFIYLVRTDGGPQEVTGEVLARALQNKESVRLVFLNSCLGAASSIDKTLNGVAQVLVASGIPAVIAMQFPISDTAAVQLASTFYRELGNGRLAEEALAEARSVLSLPGDEDVTPGENAPAEWGAPALFLESPGAALFERGGGPQAPVPAAVARPVASPRAAGPGAASSPTTDAARRKPSLMLLIVVGLVAALALVIIAARLFLFPLSDDGPSADTTPSTEVGTGLTTPTPTTSSTTPTTDPTPTTLSTDEQRLREAQIEEQLTPTIANLKVDVAPDGDVTISGQVDSAAQQQSAAAAVADLGYGDPDVSELVVVPSIVLSDIGSVTFAYRDDALSPEAERRLDEVARYLEQNGSDDLVITGHTDSDGPSSGNLELSRRRANSALRYLVDHRGVAENRLVAIGAGETQPIEPNTTPAGRQANRRLEFRAGPSVNHLVAPGDSLWAIAVARYGNGNRWPEIFEANRATIADPDKLAIGMTLVIPPG